MRGSSTRWAPRHRARLAAVLLLGVLAVLLAPSAALAHPALLETKPGAGYAVTAPPEDVSLTFNEPVTPVGQALEVKTAAGDSVAVRMTLEDDGRTLRGVPVEELGPGSYEVSYRVVALDGDLITGAFPFGVAMPVVAGSSAGGASQDDPDRVQPGTALPRTLLFLGLALALGGTAGALIAHRELGRHATLRPLVRSGSALGAAGAGFLLVQVSSGQLGDLPRLLGSSTPARLIGAEIGLFLLALAAARTPLRGRLAVAALSGVVLLEGVRAHPGEALGSTGVLLTVVHLAAAAVWVGALVHVLRLALALRGKSLATWLVVGAYARVAIALFLLVLATGTVSALLLLPTFDDWTGTTYGQVLLFKLALFGAVAVAAVWARARHRRGVEDGREVVDVKARGRWVPGRAPRIEAALLAGVLVVTAALTSATPPRLVSQTALLPAPTGAVVRTAERVNHVTVALTAASGRLDLRAYAPGPEQSNEYELKAVLQSGGGPSEDLQLENCGLGCWTTSVDWPAGESTVIADVAAEGWRGGRVEIPVRWPPEPANELLRAVQTTMGAQSEIKSTESVNSGFGAGLATVSERTGQEYLEDEPWSDGGVSDPVQYTVDGVRTLAFAMPVLRYHFTMTLDDQNRVVTARAVTRINVIERRYDYPDGA
jgi:copper transport protein